MTHDTKPAGQLLQHVAMQPGDWLQCVKTRVSWWTEKKCYEVQHIDGVGAGIKDDSGSFTLQTSSTRFAHVDGPQLVEPPKLSEMSDAEIGELWRANEKGDKLQVWFGRWCDRSDDRPLRADLAYRKKPAEPVRGTVTLYGHRNRRGWCWSQEKLDGDTHTMNLPTVDGKLVHGTFADEYGNNIEIGEL